MPEARVTAQVTDLAGLDGLSADGLLVFAYSDSGPVGGLGDLIDWRLGSCINRAKSVGHFGGGAGDQLLIPGPARLGGTLVFVFGLGPKSELSAEAFELCLTRALSAVAQAGCRRAAVAVPAAPHPAQCPDPQTAILDRTTTTNGHIIAKVLTLRVD